MADKYEILRSVFGYDSFRAAQEDIIDNISAGRDVLAVMPTGAGKSLCFQVPALMMEGVTIVISPLISLMTDQVSALKEAGVRGAYLNSSLTAAQQEKVIENIYRGVYKIVYVAPERLEVENFIAAASSLDISMVAVDEAHCISQWGQDFRPSYLNIVSFIRGLPKRPVVSAFTATATDRVRSDIASILELNDPFSVVTGFDRPNLYFGIIKERKRENHMLEMIKRDPERSGIVYCSTRKNAEKIAFFLQSNGIPSAPYHAGLSDEIRKKNQEDFIYDRIKVIAATNAFGMGIDKSNVSFVYHYNMPKDMESYYQEAGRAGRDGEPAECILFYSSADYSTNRYFITENRDNGDRELSEEDEEQRKKRINMDMKRLGQMMDYCTETQCLRKFILNYFGETLEKPCGNCSYCQKSSEKTDITVDAQKIMSCIVRVDQNFGMNLIVDILRGSSSQRIKDLKFDTLTTYGIMKDSSAERVRFLISSLVNLKYIVREGDEFPVLKITQKAMPVLKGMKKIEIFLPEDKKSKTEKAALSAKAAEEYAVDQELLAALKKLRSRLAFVESVPAYIVFSDATLRDMCAKLPRDEEEMLKVNGVGKMKMEKYGGKFLAEIADYTSKNDMGEKTVREQCTEPFAVIAEKAADIEISEESLSITAFADMLIAAADVNAKRKAITEVLYLWLSEKNFLHTEYDHKNHIYHSLTHLSEDVGILSKQCTTVSGAPYTAFLFTPKAQRFILDKIQEIAQYGKKVKEQEK